MCIMYIYIYTSMLWDDMFIPPSIGISVPIMFGFPIGWMTIIPRYTMFWPWHIWDCVKIESIQIQLFVLIFPMGGTPFSDQPIWVERVYPHRSESITDFSSGMRSPDHLLSGIVFAYHSFSVEPLACKAWGPKNMGCTQQLVGICWDYGLFLYLQIGLPQFLK